MVMPPSTNLSPNDEANPIVTIHGTPLPNPGSMPSTERHFWAAFASVASQTPRGPQQQRHSVHFSVGRRCSFRLPNAGQARNKNCHTAEDVWTFFEDVEPKQSCLFCK